MTIETELMSFKDKNGLIKPERVHAWAKSHPRSMLHRAIEWNKDKAAYQHQLWQIRQLIALHVTYENGQRRLVSLVVDRSRPGGGYRDIDDVLRDQSLHQIMLSDALNELQRMEIKYERIKELKPIWRATKQVRQKVPARKEAQSEAKQA